MKLQTITDFFFPLVHGHDADLDSHAKMAR